MTQNAPLNRLKKIIKSPVYTYIMLVLLGIGTGLMSLLLGSSIWGMEMFRSYFASALLVLLNLLPPVLLILLMYFATGRAWISFLCTYLLTTILSLINFFKMQLRGDPFIAKDIALASEAHGIMDGYTLTMNWKVYLAVFLLACGIVFTVFFVKRRAVGVKLRLIGVAAVLLVSAVLYPAVYRSESVYKEAVGDFELHRWSETQQFIGRGFVYPFIHSTKQLGSGVPDGYKEDEAAQALAEYAISDIPEGSKVNIVSIMLEAYSDLSEFDEIEFTTDVYEQLHKLQDSSVSGHLIDNVFGGGTIDTERLFLTGYSRLTDYKRPTNSYVSYLRSQGYRTEGLHAGDSWFYDRQTVHAHLGFDDYYFMDDFDNGSRRDSFFFPTVMQLYSERDASQPYFSYSLSYQNHGAYESDHLTGVEFIERGDMSDESYYIINNYLNGIYDTNTRIGEMIEFFSAETEPVVVVIYGDHKPWLGNQDSVYLDLGINIDIGTEEGIYNYYSTPYIIWANDAAKAVTGNDFAGDGGTISPTFLMNKVFSLCGFEGDDYMKASNELLEHVQVIHTPTGFFFEDGVLTQELSQEAQAVYERFLRIEYYRQNSKKY